MSNDIQDLNRNCKVHGLTDVALMRESDGFRHEHLSCGCTLETSISTPIAVGDIVLHSNMLFRVESLSDDNVCLANNSEYVEVSKQFVKRVGVDTISDMYTKDIPTEIKKETFVFHRRLQLVGYVTELLGGSVRCRVTDNDIAKSFVWPVTAINIIANIDLHKYCICSDYPHHISCSLSSKQMIVPASSSDLTGPSRYFPSATPRSSYKPKTYKSYNNYDGRNTTESGWVYPDETKAKVKVNPHGISTADLIKKAVQDLEKQQEKEDYKKPEPTTIPSRGEDIDSIVKKRRGDW